MTHKVLITAPAMLPEVDRFRPIFERNKIDIIVPNVRERLSEDELLAYVAEIDGTICGDDQYTERVLRAAPRLRVISKWGTGVDSIDREAAERLGVPVRNTPNAFTDAVADTVMAYVLSFARGIHVMDREVRAGGWRKPHRVSLAESTIGIIGAGGSIGKAVARRARACGMRVLGQDLPSAIAMLPPDSGIEPVHIEELLRESDFISLNCVLTPATRHMIGDAQIRRMKEAAVIINTARGALIDEQALVSALREGRIRGAGLDVYEIEPLPESSPLRAMDNVLLGAHAANGSPAAFERVHRNSIRNLLAGLGIQDDQL